MRAVLLVVFATLAFFSKSQDSTRFYVTLHGGIQDFKMDALNSYLSQDNDFGINKYGLVSVESGSSYSITLSWATIPNLYIGGYGGLCLGKGIGAPEGFVVPPFTTDTTFYTGSSRVSTVAIGYGLDVEYNFSGLLSTHFWKHSSMSVDLRAGLFDAFLSDYIYFPNSGHEYQTFYHHSKSFGVNTGITFSHQISNNPILSKIGVRVGYQWLKTGIVLSDLGDVVQSPYHNPSVSLDFSGLNAALLLSIGK